MKKILALVAIFSLFATASYADVGWKDKSSQKANAVTDIRTNGAAAPSLTKGTLTLPRMGFNYTATTVDVAMAATTATQITSTQLAYGIIKKSVGAGTELGTLDNGTPGQLLKVICPALSGSGTYTCTPTTKSGFTSFQLNTVLDFVVLLYLDDTYGWILISNNGCTIA